MDGIMTGEALHWLGMAHKRLPWRRWERGIKRPWVCSLVRRKLLVSLETKRKSCSGSSTSAARKRRRWTMWCGKEGSFLSGPQWVCSARGHVTPATRTCLELTPAQRSVSPLWEQHPTTLRWGDILSRFKSCSPDNQSQKEMSFCA